MRAYSPRLQGSTLRAGLLAMNTVLALVTITACSGAHSTATHSNNTNVSASKHSTPVRVRGAISPTGPWGVATRSENRLYVAGMRGIDPKTNKLMHGAQRRVRQAFVNMRHIARSQHASLRDTLRLVVYVIDMDRYRPMVNRAQKEMWGKGPYPPRTIVQVSGLNQDDIVEIEGTFAVTK